MPVLRSGEVEEDVVEARGGDLEVGDVGAVGGQSADQLGGGGVVGQR